MIIISQVGIRTFAASQAMWKAKHRTVRWNSSTLPGLYSRNVQVSQATDSDFYLWATEKLTFFHVSLSAGQRGFLG